MAWREDGAVNTILELSPEEILGCPVKEYQRYLPTWQRGFDRTGRPVVYKQYGFFENALLRDVSSIEAVTRYHVWEQEVLARLCYQQSRQTGLVVETSFAIMDLEGMAIRQVTKDFLAVVKAYANIDQTQYPETLGKLMIINAPSAFPYVWSWVKPWLDPVVASKIQIFGGPSTWQPVLFDLIGKENMPANYGGDLPRLTIDEHPYPGFEKGFKVAPALSEPVPPSPQHGRRTSDPRRESRRGSFRRAPSIGHAASGESYSSAHSNSNLPPTLHSTPSWEGAAARPTTLRFGSTRILSSPVASPLPLPSSANRFSGRYICNETNPLRYPPNTPGHDAPDGYVFSLTEKQTTVLKAIQQWMQDEQIDVNMLVNHALHPNLIILRYLRANKFDEEMSIAHMKRNIVWRKENGVLELNDKLPDEILGCSVRAYMTFLPHWQCGFDKTGRPVVYKQYGSFENTLLQDHCSLEAVTRYHIWEQEILCKLCHIQSRKRGQIVETSFAIMDLEGMAIRQVTSDFLSIVKAFAAIDQAQYPETLGKLMIINAPSLFPYVWRGVKSFLDPVVTSKIQIFGGPSTWQPVLFDLIGKENMPANYGGDLPMLTVSTPPYPMMSEPRPKSTRKIMPDGFDLERCCEEEYGNGSNGDNDGEETQSVDSSVFYDAVEQQEVNDVFNIVSQRERTHQLPYLLLI